MTSKEIKRIYTLIPNEIHRIREKSKRSADKSRRTPSPFLKKEIKAAAVKRMTADHLKDSSHQR